MIIQPKKKWPLLDCK